MSPHPRDGEGPGRGIGGGPDPEKGDGPDPETESGRDPGNGDDGRGRLLIVGATGPWSEGTEKGGTATVSVSVNEETGTTLERERNHYTCSFQDTSVSGQSKNSLSLNRSQSIREK